MDRLALITLLDGFKARNAGAEDFRITVSPTEARAIVMNLTYLKAEGVISEFYRLAEPDGCSFDIEGYTN